MMLALQRAPHFEGNGASQVGQVPGLWPLSPGGNASLRAALSTALLPKEVCSVTS